MWRWIIRALCLGLLAAGAWAWWWSHSHDTYIERRGTATYVCAAMSRSCLSLHAWREARAGRGTLWHWGTFAFGGGTSIFAGKPEFLGFGAGRLTNLNNALYIKAPLWFPMAVVTGISLWTWRRSRRIDPARAFPVEFRGGSGRIDKR